MRQELSASDRLMSWLAPAQEFRDRYWEQQPYARPTAGAEALLTWDDLDVVLRAADVDLLTVSGGSVVDVAAPRAVADVKRLMRTPPGISTVVRASERHHEGLRRIAARFAETFGGEVHVQLYATPAGTNSFGWHYDFENVFIAQILGRKDYYLRDNSVARETRLGDTLDFGAIRQETSATLCATLVAGDWLYIPRRWWHLVRCAEDALSLSVGVMPAEEIRRARRIPKGWTGRT